MHFISWALITILSIHSIFNSVLHLGKFGKCFYGIVLCTPLHQKAVLKNMLGYAVGMNNPQISIDYFYFELTFYIWGEVAGASTHSQHWQWFIFHIHSHNSLKGQCSVLHGQLNSLSRTHAFSICISLARENYVATPNFKVGRNLRSYFVLGRRETIEQPICTY